MKHSIHWTQNCNIYIILGIYHYSRAHVYEQANHYKIHILSSSQLVTPAIKYAIFSSTPFVQHQLMPHKKKTAPTVLKHPRSKTRQKGKTKQQIESKKTQKETRTSQNINSPVAQDSKSKTRGLINSSLVALGSRSPEHHCSNNSSHGHKLSPVIFQQPCPFCRTIE
jgi:hypothetical protein